MRNPHKKEKGQAIVLIAISMLALIAFAGLAIDGGMVYADRRHAQNASDAGSLSGGGAAALTLENKNIDYKSFDCESDSVVLALSEAEDAAIAEMEDNDYTQADFSVEAFCHENLTNNFDNYIDITTTITKETELTFIQIVYDGPFINRVDATTRVTPEEPYAFGNAIVALNKEMGCNNASSAGIKFGGTGQVGIIGGGAFSDGCLVAQGNCNVLMEGSLDAEDEPVKGIGFHGGQKGECPVMEPEPVYSADTLPSDSYMIDPPDCYEDSDKTIIIDGKISINNSTVLTIPIGLESGTKPNATLLCLTGTGDVLKMTGGKLYVDGVTIFLTNGGDISINGGIVEMFAPLEDEETPPGLPGVIIYAASDDDPEDPTTFDNNPESNIDIEGNHDSWYQGLIYAPAADIKITGEGDIGPTLHTQIIGWNVTLLGSASFDIVFDDTWVAVLPTSLRLEK